MTENETVVQPLATASKEANGTCPNRAEIMRYWLRPVGVAVTVAACGAAALVSHFGSASAAAAWLRGQAIAVEPAVAELGTVTGRQTPKVEFEVTNLTGQPVVIVGLTTNCGCFIAEGLPMELPARGKGVVHFSIVTPSRSGDFEQPALLQLNVKSVPVILMVRASVVDAPDKGGIDVAHN